MCRDNGIEYYMTAGSLMGAVRHQGFIPWDDDADVIMTRKNWEKFYELSKTNLPDGLILNTQYDNIDLAMTANHLTETATTELYRYHVSHPEVLGVLLDIIIMDPVPEGEEARTEYRTEFRDEPVKHFFFQVAPLVVTDINLMPYSGFNPYAGLGIGLGFGYQKDKNMQHGAWTQALVISPRAGIELFERLRMFVQYQGYLNGGNTYSTVYFGIGWSIPEMMGVGPRRR